MQTTYNFSEKTCGCQPGGCEDCNKKPVFDEPREEKKTTEHSWVGSAATLVSCCAGVAAMKATKKVLKGIIGNKAGIITTVGMTTISILVGGHMAAKCRFSIQSWETAINKVYSRR